MAGQFKSVNKKIPTLNYPLVVTFPTLNYPLVVTFPTLNDPLVVLAVHLLLVGLTEDFPRPDLVEVP